MTEPTSGTRSTAGLFSDAASFATGLFRKEVELVRTELGESAARAATALGLIVGGVVFALVALNVLSAALVAALAEMGIGAGWAALIVGAAYLLIAVVMVRIGTRDLKAVNLAPKRTAESVRRDAQVLKETINGQR